MTNPSWPISVRELQHLRLVKKLTVEQIATLHGVSRQAVREVIAENKLQFSRSLEKKIKAERGSTMHRALKESWNLYKSKQSGKTARPLTDDEYRSKVDQWISNGNEIRVIPPGYAAFVDEYEMEFANA